MQPAVIQQPGAQPIERPKGAFDYRNAALMTIVITRPDLLNEYLTDGKEKDDHGVPRALTDPALWPNLRRLGMPPAMLAGMLFLFERDDVQAALRTVQVAARTMSALSNYCDEGCYPDPLVCELITATGFLTQSLKPAGVEVEA